MEELTFIQELSPLLIPNFSLRLWNGVIAFEGEEITASISTPHFPSLKSFSLMCPIQFQNRVVIKLRQYEIYLKEQKKNNSLFHLLHYLKSLESKVESDSSSDRFLKSVDYSLVKQDYYLYNQILKELKELESDSIVTCSGDLSEVTLRTVDIRGNEHLLVVGLSREYPAKKPTIKDMDLPDVAVTSLNQAHTIVDVFKTFQTLVDSFQEYWNTYNSLTKNTWLIDPEHPRRRDSHCRIIIGEDVSMLITFNPQDINTCPDIKFLGPEKAVGPFLESLEKKLKTDGWDEDMSVHDNLLNLLNLSQFPQPDMDTEISPRLDECSICFLVRLEDQTLPTKICNNSKCSSYFHIPCLAQWFQAVPTNETSFNLISGDCPCCGENFMSYEDELRDQICSVKNKHHYDLYFGLDQSNSCGKEDIECGTYLLQTNLKT